jgi:hypothetical protein
MVRNGSEIRVTTESKDEAANDFLIVSEEVPGGGIMLRYGGSSTGDKRSDESRAVVVSALNSLVADGHTTVSVKAVEERTGKKREAVRKQLRALASEGMIVQLPSGQRGEEQYDISPLSNPPSPTSSQLPPLEGGEM